MPLQIENKLINSHGFSLFPSLTCPNRRNNPSEHGPKWAKRPGTINTRSVSGWHGTRSRTHCCRNTDTTHAIPLDMGRLPVDLCRNYPCSNPGGIRDETFPYRCWCGCIGLFSLRISGPTWQRPDRNRNRVRPVRKLEIKFYLSVDDRVWDDLRRGT